jgi:hypothetical protein
MAKALTDEMRQLRADLVEFMNTAIQEKKDSSFYTDEQVEELTKQMNRVSKFLGVTK